MAISVLVFLRIEFNLVSHHRVECYISEMLHFEEPLRREFRLDRYVGTLREAHLIVVVFRLLHQSGCLQVLGNLLAHRHTVLSDIYSGSLTDGAVIIEDVDGL